MKTLILALLLCGATSAHAGPPPSTWSAFVDRDGIVHIRVYGPEKLGARKVYVHATALPTCPVCPPGPAAQYVVDGSLGQIELEPKHQYVESRFPVSLIGGLTQFYFVATWESPAQPERIIADGPCPGSE